MFFKIYFSRRKFEQDAAALVQKQNDWAAGAYCGARILSASPDEQCISPLEAKKKIWQANSDFAINNIGEVLGGLKRAREELFALDTWDKHRKSRIDSKLKTAKRLLGAIGLEARKKKGRQMSLADKIEILEEENRQMFELLEKVARGIHLGCDTEDVIRIASDVKNFCIEKHRKA